MRRHLQFICLVGVLALAGCAVQPVARVGFDKSIWVTRFDYASAEDIERIMRDAAGAGFSAVMFQVRGNGTVYYRSAHELWAEKFGFSQPAFDPLAVAVEQAHARGLELHAWLNVSPGWRGDVDKADPRQLVRSRPDWFLADARGPVPLEAGYYWLDTDQPSVRAYLAEICLEVARNYSIDGVHLDHVRRPSGHGRGHVDGVTELVRSIRRRLQSMRRPPMLTAAVFADAAIARSKVGQDWPRWAREGLVDALVPMNYTDDDAVFERRTRSAVAVAGGVPVIAGIGVYKHRRARQSTRQCSIARDAGAAGVCLFSYSAMFAPGKESFRGVARGM